MSLTTVADLLRDAVQGKQIGNTAECVTARELAKPVIFILIGQPDLLENTRLYLTLGESLDVAHIPVDITQLMENIRLRGDSFRAHMAADPRNSRVTSSCAMESLGEVRGASLMQNRSHGVLVDKDNFRLMAYRLNSMEYVKDKLSLRTLDQVPRKLAKLCVKYGRGHGNTVNALALTVFPALHGVFMYTKKFLEEKACFNCHKHMRDVPGGLKVCLGCARARYCNRECQVQHRRAHKRTCIRLPPGAEALGPGTGFQILEDIQMRSAEAQDFLGRVQCTFP